MRGAVLFALSLLFLGLSATQETQVPVYVNESYVGMGIVRRGVTYVPLRVVSEKLGASVNYEGRRVSVHSSPKTAPPEDSAPVEAKALFEFKDQWHEVAKSKRYIRIKDPVLKPSAGANLPDTLEFDLELRSGLFVPKGKPLSLEFSVRLLDGHKTLLQRGNIRLPNCSESGGRYVLKVPLEKGVETRHVMFVEIEYIAGWVTGS